MFGFDKVNKNNDDRSEAISSTDGTKLKYNGTNATARAYEKMLEELESEVRGHIRF